MEKKRKFVLKRQSSLDILVEVMGRSRDGNKGFRRAPSAWNLESKAAKQESLINSALRLSYPLVEHGLLAMDKGADVFSRFLNTTEGRDKLFKGLQSVCRIVGEFLSSRSKNSPSLIDISERITYLEKSCSTCRKYLKLGMSMTFFRLLFRVATLEPFSLLKCLVLGRFLGLSVYFTFDNIAWAIKTKLFQGDTAWYVTHALRWYLLSIACTVILDTIQFRMNAAQAQRLRDLKEQSQEQVIHTETPVCDSFSSQELEELKDFGENDTANALSSHRAYLNGSNTSGFNVSKELNFIYDKQVQVVESFIKNFLDIISAANTVYHWNLSRGTRGWLNIISAYIAGRRLWLRIEAEACAERQRSVAAGEKSGAMGGYDWSMQQRTPSKV